VTTPPVDTTTVPTQTPPQEQTPPLPGQ
jgi:hypothetical protein